ncbi:MAG: DUF2232 domain-containing protein, partial [Thermodesulfobacteriota bacterium]|nr:DUF2232 domain-containing protein [Thermodesulfobacteriota bacterium]
MKEAGGGIFNRDFFFAAAITSLVFIVVAAFSILSSFGALLLPLPLLYYYSRLGRVQGIFIFFLSLLAVMITLRVFDSPLTLQYFFLLGALGPLLSEVLRRDYSIEKTVLYGVGAFLALGLSFLLFYSLILGKSPWTLIEFYIFEIVRENIDSYTRIGVYQEHLDIIRENAGYIAKALTNLFPSLILVGSSFCVWVNILEGKLLFEKKGMWYPEFGDLSRWKIFDRMIWVFIIAGVFVVFPVKVIKIVGLNILIVLLFIYMLQGISIVSFYFKRKNMPWFIRGFGYFLIFAQQILLFLVIGL